MLMTGHPDTLAPAASGKGTHHDGANLSAKLQAQDQRIKAWSWLPDSIDAPTHADGPLAGLTFGVKDIIDVRGMPTRCGAELPETEAPCAFDAAVVAQLRQAGAIPAGKTVTAEFAYVTPGPTANPWNTGHTPGGSSSGSAAAVAAGMVPVALGTQTGGSIIRPAAFNGVVGFKPSFGRIHRGGMAVLCESLDTIGWFTPDVPLARKVLNVLLPGPQAQSQAPSSTPRIVMLPSGNIGPLSPLALQTLQQAGEQIRQMGGNVDIHEPEAELARLIALHADIMAFELSRGMLPFLQAGEQWLSKAIRDTIQRGLAIPAARYQDCMQERVSLNAAWQDRYAGYDAILTPSAPGEAPEGLQSTGTSIFNRVWSLLGWPSVHLPTSISAAGLPLGVQLVGKPGQDDLLLAQADAWHTRLDQRPASAGLLAPGAVAQYQTKG